MCVYVHMVALRCAPAVLGFIVLGPWSAALGPYRLYSGAALRGIRLDLPFAPLLVVVDGGCMLR